MRFGNWRGVTLALALGSALATIPTTAFANPFHHDIPREVDAVDVNTGGPYYAPPVPYGHYAKGGVGGPSPQGVGGLTGRPPRQLRGHGGCGHGDGCGSLRRVRMRFLQGRGLFGHGHGGGGDAAATPAAGRAVASSRGTATSRTGRASAVTTVAGTPPGSPRPGCMGSSQQVITSSPQAPIASGQCGEAGCGIKGRHRHMHGSRRMAVAASAAAMAAAPAEGVESVTSAAAAAGRDAGSAASSGTSRASSAAVAAAPVAASAARRSRSWARRLLHKNKIKYFVGPGGPVPITPGYVPYVITTRSPRDFLAFPPFTP